MELIALSPANIETLKHMSYLLLVMKEIDPAFRNNIKDLRDTVEKQIDK